MTTKIVWRLANRPTSEEIVELSKAGLLNKEEAREILFNLETTEDRDKKGLQAEIEFLRKLVQNLSTSRQVVIQTIREVQKPYVGQPWYVPYAVWCNSLPTTTGAYYTSGTLTNSTSLSGTASTSAQIGGNTTASSYNMQAPDVVTGFTEIKTF
jgi:hypothetical protein